MSNNENPKEAGKKEDDGALKPDPETLNTPDPQDKMKGPISSLVHEAGEALDSDETKEEADEEKEKDI